MKYYKVSGHYFKNNENAKKWAKLGNSNVKEFKTYNPFNIMWLRFISSDYLLNDKPEI